MDIKETKSFLDFGGGSCDIAYYIGSFLNLDKDNIYCVDVDEWSGFEWEKQRRKDVTFMTSMKTIPDNSIDLILASYVLHHLTDKEIKDTLENFYRILSKNGSIILIEHDSSNKNFNYLLDLQHMLYDTVISQNITYSKFKKTHYSNYKSLSKWNKIFTEVNNFKLEKIIKDKSLDKSYYAIYKK